MDLGRGQEPCDNCPLSQRVHALCLSRADVGFFRFCERMCRSHANRAATTFADKTVVLHDGIIEQVGTPVDLYECTDNTCVAQSIGSLKMNLFTSEGLTEKR